MRKYAAVLTCSAALLAAVACRKHVVDVPVRGPARAASQAAASTEVHPVPVKGVVTTQAQVGGTQLFLQSTSFGSQLGADGTVAQPAKVFQQTQPISLTMRFTQSPPGLHASALWKDARGKVVLTQDEPMNGRKVVTFTQPANELKPGHYHVTGYWGGDIAAEQDFEVK